ncbi:MAG: amidohydrolase family protein [Bacteroidetes bacterium]|nr:amidohydrolase family protein [Bacteroidota bacterium]
MHLRLLFFSCFVTASTLLSAQVSFPLPAPSDQRDGLYAFTNATIYIDYKTVVENATLLIQKGIIVASGRDVRIPKEAVVINCTGKSIYPAFIEVYGAGYGLPVQAPAPQNNGASNTKRGAYAWNEALRPEYAAVQEFSTDSKSAGDWRRLGFGAILSFKADGIARGTGVLVSLNDSREHENIVTGKAANFFSFRKGSSNTTYPTALMGCIALLRQTYLDAQWYKDGGYKEEKNLGLEAWNDNKSLPQIFEADNKQDVLRIARIGQEFGVKYAVKTAGDDYQRLEEIKLSGQTLILPLNFPEAYDVKDPFDADQVSLRELKHWEMAPSNPARIEAAGIPFVLTTADLKEKSRFWEQLRKAIEHGLSEQAALKALTASPAELLRVADKMGTLQAGKLANFLVTSGNIFKSETKILQNWNKGAAFYFKDPADQMPAALNGTYQLQWDGRAASVMQIKGNSDAPEVFVQLSADTTKKTKINFSIENGIYFLSFAADSSEKAQIRLSGVFDGAQFSGQGKNAAGKWITWSAVKTNTLNDLVKDKSNSGNTPNTGVVCYPFGAFGWSQKPSAQDFVVRNATVWTSESNPVLEKTDVWVKEGKINKIGSKLNVPGNTLEIDGSGKFLSAGIIDEHSHIAVSRGVNEFGQESSAEVRIGDVLDAEDIDIYRQLAGGVTSSHILHGSANPIGGQTQLIKLRWGYAPEDLKFQNWPGFIKFALGENVKQSNNGGEVKRYPRTRMGVEQTFVDYFNRAKTYGQIKRSGGLYRKDLELEALLEIIEKQRFITCHSYVQSEITMMMRVATQFGFKINTFTHILEGYKVADKMAKHGVAGSTFSDWWSYKYEVVDAIPHNAKMMHDAGVLVCINSDDAEMARRLNQEAAKSVMYGGMSEADAWKMVTLNPAKALHVDERVGSIKEGKDADLVLWSANPLSVYAHADKTWVDGILFFDLDNDRLLRQAVQDERNRLIQKMLNNKKGGDNTEKPSPSKKYHHCDSQDDEG